MQTLKNWLARTKRAQQDAIAVLAGTSARYLQQVAGGHSQASAKCAAAVEAAAQQLGEPLTRGDICVECRQCPYFKKFQQGVDLI